MERPGAEAYPLEMALVNANTVYVVSSTFNRE